MPGWMDAKKGKQRQADRPGESCGQTDGGRDRHIQERPAMNTTCRHIISLLIPLFFTMSSLLAPRLLIHLIMNLYRLFTVPILFFSAFFAVLFFFCRFV